MVQRFPGVEIANSLEEPGTIAESLRNSDPRIRWALLLVVAAGSSVEALTDLPAIPTVVLRMESSLPEGRENRDGDTRDSSILRKHSSDKGEAEAGGGTSEPQRPLLNPVRIILNSNADSNTLYRAICSVTGRGAIVPLTVPGTEVEQRVIIQPETVLPARTPPVPIEEAPAPQPESQKAAGPSGEEVLEGGDRFGLSERQYEIAFLAAAGLSNKEIGDRLFIDIDTVKFHLKAAFRKLGVKRRSQIHEKIESLKG